MKKLVLCLNILLATLVIAGDISYMLHYSVITKGIASGLFVALGVINLIYALKNKTPHKTFAIVLVLGLFFAMLGDIVLEIQFIIGAALFALGHVLFFVSYCFIHRFHIKDLLYGAIIFVPMTLVIVFAPIFDFNGILMQIVCIVYAIIISCMVGKAVNNFIVKKDKLSLIVLIGSILFILSDAFLLFSIFANASKIVGALCLITYYPAEIMLAISPLATIKTQQE